VGTSVLTNLQPKHGADGPGRPAVCTRDVLRDVFLGPDALDGRKRATGGLPPLDGVWARDASEDLADLQRRPTRP
jgi:hypothetical protein